MLQFASRLLLGVAVRNSLTKTVTVTSSPLLSVVRSGSIFSSIGSERLWEGVTGPAGQSKKRARGKRRVTRPKIDLNLGQEIGVGKKAVNWPGLNAPLEVEISQGQTNEELVSQLLTYRNQRAKKKSRPRPAPLERGWSGGKRGGENRPPPEGEPGIDLSDFTTTILECKMVSNMTATKGRSGRFSVLVVLGNQKGVAGFGRGKAPKMSTAISRAAVRASRKLEYFQLFENNRTLWHDAYKQGGSVKLFTKSMPDGYGLVCHRVLKSICKAIGIKDMYAKVENCPHNYQQLTKSFFQILREQESYQELANREKLHVVEVSMERDNYPRILASPDEGETRTIDPEEDLDLSFYYYGGRVPNIKVNPKPGYLKGAGQMKRARERYRFRNQDKCAMEREVLAALRPELLSGQAS